MPRNASRPAPRPAPREPSADASDGGPADAVADATVDPRAPGWHRARLAPGVAAVRVRGGPGPEIVLVGRGDDALAAAALAALAVELDPDGLRGACTIVPACDLDDPATADAFDAGPLARAALVLEIAADEPALAWSTAAVVRLPPGARRGARGDPLAEAAMVAFGAPESVRLHVGPDPGPAPDPAPGARPGAAGDGAFERPDIDLGEPGEPGEPAGSTPRPLAERAARRGVPHVEVRCGASLAGLERLALLRAGCRNVLVDAGVLAAPLELRVTRHLELGPCGGGGAVREIGTTVRAGAHGLLEVALAPGADVHAGTVLARVRDPARPADEPAELLAPHDGALLACRRDGPVAPGDRLALIADEMQP